MLANNSRGLETSYRCISETIEDVDDSIEPLDDIQNDLCNSTDDYEHIGNDTRKDKGLILDPGDALPSNAGFREVHVEDLEAGVHEGFCHILDMLIMAGI